MREWLIRCGNILHLYHPNDNPIQPSSPTQHASTGPNKYSRLPSTADSPHREYIVQLEQQQEMLQRQDDTMDLMADSMGNIRNMSEHISNELDEQAV